MTQRYVTRHKWTLTLWPGPIEKTMPSEAAAYRDVAKLREGYEQGTSRCNLVVVYCDGALYERVAFKRLSS